MFAIEDKRVKSGDQCILWRGGPGGGVVAIGEVAKVRAARLETLEPEAALGKQIRARPDRHILEFATLLLASPLSPGVLEATGLGQVAKQARAQGKGGTVVPLALSVEQFQRMVQLADEAKPPSGWPTAWNITPGSVVARRKLHEIYGGNARVPAGSSARTPNAFLFLSTRRRGDLAPRWNGSTLFAPGHGQHAGDLSQENLAILTHVRRGVPLRVFLTKGSECLYLGEFFADPKRPVEQWAITGQRDGGVYGDQHIIWDIQTPLFRLRQLTGVKLPVDSEEPFRSAPRINLALHPSDDRPAATAVQGLLAMLERDPSIAASLGAQDEAQLLASLVQRARQQADLDALRAAAENRDTTEETLRRLLERATWIFGGEFLPGTGRRNLTVLDQLDLVLLRADGSLHGVELKRANIAHLVKKHRNHLIVDRLVNEAAGQAMNYLRELDEKRPQILADLKLDSRRASMTVVIGHSGLDTTGATPQEVNEAIRTYNSHLSRVSVITYDTLIENAQRLLDITAPDR